MSKHLVLVGGGHAHLATLKNLREITGRGHRVTLVSEFASHDYSGMGPGLLAGQYAREQLSFPLERMTRERGGVFLEDRVIGLDARRQVLTTALNREIAYDVLSFNIGSTVPMPPGEVPAGKVFPVKPIANLALVRERLRHLPAGSEQALLVIGGGPAGVELASALWALNRKRRGSGSVILVAGGRLLPGCSPRVAGWARQSLASQGIEILEGVRLERFQQSAALLENGRSLPFDLALVATGVRPPELFRSSLLPVGLDGGLLVNRFLQSTLHGQIFGGGDCICYGEQPLDKVGVYAVRQGEILRHNLLAALEGAPLKAFRPQRRYMLIFNLCNGRGLLQRGRLEGRGAWAYWLKDRIDRRFVDRLRS